MPFIPPVLCSRLEWLERLTDRRYTAEPKLDGQRAQVHISKAYPAGLARFSRSPCSR